MFYDSRHRRLASVMRIAAQKIRFSMIGVSLLLSLPWTAQAQLLGLGLGFAPASIFDVNVTSGHATTVGTIPIFGASLAYDSNRDVYYASDPVSSETYSVNPKTLAVTPLFAGYYQSLAYDPFNDLIYGSFGNAVDLSIFKINAATHAVQDLGNPGLGFVYALGFDTTTRHLNAVATGVGGFSGDGDFVVFNDPNTITDHTLISELDKQGFELVEALAYDASIDRYYGSATNNPFRSLILINPNNGLAQAIGPFDIGNDSIVGLAVRPVPLPPALGMLGLGWAGLVCARRKTRQARRQAAIACRGS